MVRHLKIFFFVSMLGVLAGCASTEEYKAMPVVPTPKGNATAPAQKQGVIYHKVQHGQTLWQIAELYGVSMKDIIEINKIPNESALEVGQLLLIPGATAAKETPAGSEHMVDNNKGQFTWPLKGRIVVYFDDPIAGGLLSHGIDIQTQAGDTVNAAREGDVVLADYMTGYGQTVMIDHRDGFISVYAHNAKLLVKLGDHVYKGDPVAEVGQIGSRVVEHFEIRHGSQAMNPFILFTMNLIDFDHNFYGRHGVLEVLKKRVMGLKDGYRQNVALLGNRYIGKTALLHRLMSQMEEHDVSFLYLDLENRSFDYFALQFTKCLLYNYLKKRNLPLQEDLKLLCAEAKQHLPRTVFVIQAVEELRAQGKPLEAYRMILSLPEVFTQETNKPLVLIFDEFSHLENFNIQEVFVELGQHIMTQKNSLYIAASSFPQQAQTILSEKLSLLFGNFENIALEPFSFNEAQGLIDHNLEGTKIGLQLKNFIADFTGGHPLFINLLCQELICLSGVYGQKEIYAPIVTQAIENVVFNPWGVISRHFELQIKALTAGKSTEMAISILCALAQGKHKVSDLAEALQLKPAQVTTRINALLEENIVERNGNYFHIKEKLFSYWTKYVYQRRLRVIDLEVGRSRKQFKEEISRALNDFGMVARKDLSVRMSDLMHKFDNEAFTLCGRRYKLSSFRDIKVLKLRTATGNYFDAISAEAQEGLWLVVLKKDPVHDNDLNGILEEIKKLEPRPTRSVIVSLSGLDENARVRALQEKLWVWDEEQLNSLMHLFDEPIIVR